MSNENNLHPDEISDTIPRARDIRTSEHGSVSLPSSSNTKVRCLDIIKEKLLSRKLLAFGVASYLFSIGQLTEQSWMVITIGYMGIQGMGDMVKLWKEQK